jgi:hypothetical protein
LLQNQVIVALPRRYGVVFLVFDFVSVWKEDVEENADHVAKQRSGGAACRQGLNGSVSKPVAQWERHRQTCHGKN